MKKALHAILIIALMCGGSVLTAHTNSASAQTLPPRVTENDISILINPESPDAFQDITITVRTFSIDLDIHYIEWFVDGERKKGGFGEKSIVVQTKDYGEAVSVEARITTQEGILNKRITLRPATLDIMWEALNSYVPPFYKGKALPTVGAVLKLSAIPQHSVNGSLQSPNQFDYSWGWEYKNKATASGFGKSYMAIQNSILRNEENVSVAAQNISGTFYAERSIRVPITQPQTLLYDTISTIPRLVQNYATSNNRLVLRAEPFYFSLLADGKPDSMLYEWKINNTVTESRGLANILPIEIAGSAQILPINLIIQHPRQLEQRQTVNAVINFTDL